MDDDKIATLAENFYARLAQLGAEFEQQIKILREDALKSTLEEMGKTITTKLGSIESRLSAVEAKLEEDD